MRTFLFATSATLPLLTGVPVQAADMPIKNPMSKPPVVYSWTGLYFGGQVGAGWSNNDWEPVDFSGLNSGVARVGAGSGTGFLGGVQLGVNRQLDAMVFGIEADVTWAALSGDACSLADGLILCNSKANRFGTIAGRFGIATDRALVYLKGGAAWLHSTHVFSVTNAGNSTASGTKWGWTAGAGVEYALTRNWSAKLEYDFMDFGSSRFPFFDALIVIDVKQNIQTVKFGLNYKLDWGGPVTASY